MEKWDVIRWVPPISTKIMFGGRSQIFFINFMSSGKESFLIFILGNVVPGLPPFQLPWQSRDPPQISVNGSHVHNPSSETIFDPIEILQDLGMGLFLLPIVSVLPQAATAQFYAREWWKTTRIKKSFIWYFFTFFFVRTFTTFHLFVLGFLQHKENNSITH